MNACRLVRLFAGKEIKRSLEEKKAPINGIIV